MSGVLFDAALISFNSRLAKKAVNDAFRRVLRKAVEAWVRTAEEIIPVYSGAARATLRKLASDVGINVPITPTPNAVKRVGDRTSLGEAAGANSKLIEVPGRYGFKYSADLPHLIANETIAGLHNVLNLKTPTPYNFREQADEAFRKVFFDELAKENIPKIIQDNLKVKRERLQ